MKSILPFSKRLLWSQIKEMYASEWVELSDVDWPSDSIFPRRAIVKNHAEDRDELMKISTRIVQGRGDTVIFYVGNSETSVALNFTGAAA
jgi:hypothetical protein